MGIGWLIGGLLVGAALASSGDSSSSSRSISSNECSSCRCTGRFLYINDKGKYVYKCPRCGHKWSTR